MSLEEFIAENSWVEYHSGEKTFVMEVDALRELLSGKAIVDKEALKIVVGMTLGLGYHGKPITRTDLDAATDKLLEALVCQEIPTHPASSGDNNG